MLLTDVERMNALLLAKSMATNNGLMEIAGSLETNIKRLDGYKLFTVGEISDFAGISEYRVKKVISPTVKSHSGVVSYHLDHLIRMVGNYEFANMHIKSLLETGAKIEAIARITGIPSNTLRNWLDKENELG